MTLSGTIRHLYRSFVPEALRRLIRAPLVDGIYGDRFYSDLEELQSASYDSIAATLIDRLSPAGVVDVGCGSGGLLDVLARRGVTDLLGLERSEAAIAAASKRGLDVLRVDLREPLLLPARFDLAVCLEVAKHLPPEASDSLVTTLTSGPRRLVFSAATPGQGGDGHINEQPHEYWISRFRSAGFIVNDRLTETAREEWGGDGVASWYCVNVFFLEPSETSACSQSRNARRSKSHKRAVLRRRDA